MNRFIENTPRCRLCGHQLKSAAGCAVCNEVKKVLVWPVVEDANNEVSATEVVNSTLRALKRRLKRLEREMHAEDGSYNTALTKDLTAIGRTLKELAAEQRKLEDREEERYGSLGIEGRMELFVREFFAMLPEDFQVKLLMDMKKAYDTQNSSLLPGVEHNSLE